MVMITIIVTCLLLQSSFGLIPPKEDIVSQQLTILVSRILLQMPKCLVVVMSEDNTLLLPTDIYQMRSSFNSSELVMFLIATYKFKCTGYLVDEENAYRFLTSLATARLEADERHTPRVVVVSTKSGYYSELLFNHKEALFIPDMITIQIDDTSKEEVKLTVLTNDFQGNLTYHKGEALATSISDETDFFPDKIRNLKGKSLTLAAFHYPPFFLLQPQIDGSEALVSMEFCRLYNCSISVITDDDIWGEIFDNGTGIGILGNVYMDRADIGCDAFPTWVREYHFIDYSMPYTFSRISCLVPKPKQVERWRTVFLPFSLTMWALQVISIATAAVFMYGINQAASKISFEQIYSGELSSVAGIFLRAVGMSLLQPPPRVLYGSALRRFFTIFEVLFLFFTTIYSGALSSVLTVPKYYPTINSPQMLYEAGIPWGGNHIAWIFFIREATEYYFKGLLESFEVHDIDTLTDLFIKGGYGFSMEVMEAGHVPPLDFLSAEAMQNYHIMKTGLYSPPIILLLRKGSPYTQKINQLLGRCRAAGLFLLWETQVTIHYLSNRLQTALEISKGSKVEVHHPTKLKLSHIQGAFILLGIGYCFSCFVFFIERIRSMNALSLKKRNIFKNK